MFSRLVEMVTITICDDLVFIWEQSAKIANLQTVI